MKGNGPEILASTHTAVKMAQEAALYLTAVNIYADMSSISGSVKTRIAEVIESSQADYFRRGYSQLLRGGRFQGSHSGLQYLIKGGTKCL